MLEITWRIVEAEEARREGITTKATSLATFAALTLSLTATTGGKFLSLHERWALTLYLVSLLSLAGAVAVGAYVLLPRQRQALSMSYINQFPLWDQIVKQPEEVQGDTMRGLIAALAHDRKFNNLSAQQVFRGFVLLFGGLALVAVEAGVVAATGSH